MKTNLCAESVVGGTADDQSARGGSIPASALFFHAGDTDDVHSLIMNYHYSRRMPGSIQYVAGFYTAGGLFGSRGECVAGITFSSPPTRWTEPVWELSRLVRRDGVRVPLTKLISLSLSKIRDRVDLVVSFADWTQKHIGVVYQAAGWNYHGKRDQAMDGLIIDGVFMPGRSCNAAWGTRSPERLAKILPRASIKPHYDEGKHLYWKALSRSGTAKASRLSLNSNAYYKCDAQN